MGRHERERVENLVSLLEALSETDQRQVLASLEGLLSEEALGEEIPPPFGHDSVQQEETERPERDGISVDLPARPGVVHSRNKLNELTGNAWSFFTKTVVQTSYPSELGHRLRREHYANKPPALMKQIVEFFTKRGQSVLDPFAGVGGTLLGASLSERRAMGVELEQRWIDIYLTVCHQEGLDPQEVICGDSLEVLPRLVEQGREFDAIITDPPYSPALKKTMCDGRYGLSNRRSPFEFFSSSPKDFRNAASFEEFYDRMEQAAQWFWRLLKPNCYTVVMIRDSYQNGEYVPASFHVAERFRQVGFRFKGIRIWYQTGAPVRPYGYPYAYVPNIVHHNILVFRKED